MTPSQERKREKIVKAMKKNFSDFRQRYGSDAKSVMYATATKQAIDENSEEEKAAIRADAMRISKQSAQRKAAGKKLIDPETGREVGAKKDTTPIDPSKVKVKKASSIETQKHEKKMRKFDRSQGGVISKGRKGRNVGFSGSMLLKRNFPESFMSFGQFFLAEQEQLDELDRKTLGSYITKASDARGHRGLPTRKVDSRYSGVARAGRKIDKMEKKSIKEDMHDVEPSLPAKAKKKVMFKSIRYKGCDNGNNAVEMNEEKMKLANIEAGSPSGDSKPGPTVQRALDANKGKSKATITKGIYKRIQKDRGVEYPRRKTNEENIDELNVRTMRSYKDKAAGDLEDRVAAGHTTPTDKTKKRMQGIGRASDKIQTAKIKQRQRMGVNEDFSSDAKHDYYDGKLDRAGKELGIATNTKISDNDAHKIASEHELHVQKTGDHLYQDGISMGYKHPKGHEYEAMSSHIEMHNKYQKEDRFPGPVSPDEKHYSDKEGFNANRKMMKMMQDIRKKRDLKQIGTRKEELSGSQHKLDTNKNGRIDAHDFKLLRQRKK